MQYGEYLAHTRGLKRDRKKPSRNEEENSQVRQTEQNHSNRRPNDQDRAKQNKRPGPVGQALDDRREKRRRRDKIVKDLASLIRGKRGNKV